MFLQRLKKRNPDFIRASVQLHQDGLLPSNCYVLDLDALEANARFIRESAAKLSMRALGMTKQIGRHKPALDAIVAGGIESFVAVNISGFRSIIQSGHKVGHVGHLVQIPVRDIPACIAGKPDYWTVFNSETLPLINQAASDAGICQNIFLRIYSEGDSFYEGHAGGIPVKKLQDTIDGMERYGSLHFAGITTFPCLLYDEASRSVYKTENLKTLSRTAAALRSSGLKGFEVNAPGTTSGRILPMLAEEGVTQVEPGHGLTGTTPLHAVEDLEEQPGVLYLSEIAHVHRKTPYFYGGGLYIDPVFHSYVPRVLTAPGPDDILDRSFEAQIPPYQAIDYYGMIRNGEDAGCRIGDSVILGFRPQAFVRTSLIASIRGISKGQPEVAGISDSNGGPVTWP